MLKNWLKNYFLPYKCINILPSVDLEELKKIGIKNILLDLDDTIIAINELTPSFECLEWLNEAKKHFNVYIVSNNRNKDRVNTLKKQLDIPIVFKAYKPSTKKVKLVLKELNADNTNTIIIGDRIFTDVLVANRLKIKSILLKPICNSDKLMDKLIRKLENKLLNYLLSP